MPLGLVLHLPVLLVLAGLHLPIDGVADGGAGSNLALSQDRSWGPGVTAGRLAHTGQLYLGILLAQTSFHSMPSCPLAMTQHTVDQWWKMRSGRWRGSCS